MKYDYKTNEEYDAAIAAIQLGIDYFQKRIKDLREQQEGKSYEQANTN